MSDVQEITEGVDNIPIGQGDESHACAGGQKRQCEIGNLIRETKEPKSKKRKQKEDLILCNHCGNCAPERNNLCDACDRVHKKKSDQAVKALLDEHQYTHLLCMGIHVEYLNGKNFDGNKGIKRERKLEELVKAVSALRNTESGFILVHIVGLSKQDTSTETFNEFADDKLESLITDHRRFAEVYKKTRLSSHPQLTDYHDFLLLSVEKSFVLISFDTKTKEALDTGNSNFGDDKLRYFLKKKIKFQNEHPKHEFKSLVKFPLEESTEVQNKAIVQNGKGDEWLSNHLLWELKLPLYVSAFSKNENGGLYIAGIKEIKKEMQVEAENGKYLTKKLFQTPATVNDIDTFSSCIKDGVKDNCLVCDYDGNTIHVEDLVNVQLEPSNDKYIIFVSVRPVCGLVFHDCQGPVAYFEEEQGIKTFPFDRWFNKQIQSSMSEG